MDIYLNRKNLEEPPEEPNEDDYINTINLEQHKLLSNFVNEFIKIGIAFSFFEDFTLSPKKVVNIKYVLLNKKGLIVNSEEGKKAYNILVGIIDSAANEESGLISYSD